MSDDAPLISEPPLSASPVERRLREREKAAPTEPPSLLLEMLRLLEGDDGRWKANFSDLSGIAQLLSDLRLPVVYQLHRCEFCAFAKGDVLGLSGCVKNKHAVNRLVLRRETGVVGFCHLGVTDIVEPLRVGGRVAGIFFLGSVVERETEGVARERLLRDCRRRGREPGPVLAAWEALPRVTAEEIANRRRDLNLVARLTARLAESAGRTATEPIFSSLSGAIWEVDRRKVPDTLRRAIAFVRRHYREPLKLQTVAEALGVRADYLGALFRRHTGGTLNEFLASVRVDHARRLLEGGRFRSGEVALMVGFADQPHFSKTFKRLTGLAPREYVERV